MHGNVAGDVLSGGLGLDTLRGAHGNDDLWDLDSNGAGDHDLACTGEGEDDGHIDDGDGVDNGYRTNENDFDLDRMFADGGDIDQAIAGPCPYSDAEWAN